MLKHTGFSSFVSKFLLFVCFVLTTASCAGFEKKETHRYISNPQNVEHLLQSTVGLYSEERNSFYCSGFYVSQDVIVTARHCLTDAAELDLMRGAIREGGNDMHVIKNHILTRPVIVAEYDAYRKETQESLKKAKILYISTGENQEAFDNYDMALLRLNPDEKKSLHWLKIAKENPKIGEHVYSFAFPLGVQWILSEGIVSQYVIDAPGTPIDYLIINSTVTFGSSGSGFVNNKGEVVGLTSMVAANTTFLAFVMSAERMHVFSYGWELDG